NPFQTAGRVCPAPSCRPWIAAERGQQALKIGTGGAVVARDGRHDLCGTARSYRRGTVQQRAAEAGVSRNPGKDPSRGSRLAVGSHRT
ncbi:hypothetical protein, partial [Escherichia coli]|uniref:hypothetical protein n=1 Tax=Escherichia coli TaxID=562 RepID=UPI0032E46483